MTRPTRHLSALTSLAWTRAAEAQGHRYPQRDRRPAAIHNASGEQTRSVGTTATQVRSLQPAQASPSPQRSVPEDTRHLQEDMDRITKSIERRRRAGQLAAHAAVRVQPRRRRAKRTAPVFINKPELTVGYDQLTAVQQRALANVVGSGRTLVQTVNQLTVIQLNELGLQRLKEARSEATWKSLGSPYNQFQRFRLEALCEEAQDSAMELQLIWWVESKLVDGSISLQTGNKYVRRVRQVFDIIQTPYEPITLEEYAKALSRQGGKAPEHQALPAERGDIEAAMDFLAPNEQPGLMTEWKTASRTGEMMFLSKEDFVRTIVETPQGSKIIWIVTFPYHKGDPFRLGTAIPVDFGSWEPRILEHYERLLPGERWTTLTTDRLTAVLGRVREGLTSHSVKRGALVTMLRAGVPLPLIQAIAKHKDLETLMIYLPRAEVALALRMWEATTPL